MVAPTALLLLALLGCGAEPEQETTLPTSGQPAKTSASAEALVGPVTAEALREHVEGRARALAAAEYVPPDLEAAEQLASVDYETYRGVRFRPEAAIWSADSRFQIQLMHPGTVYRRPVRIHLVEEGEAGAALPFDTGLFEYEGRAGELTTALPDGIGFSGFRVHYPLNDPEVMDEVVVFQGASYFRLLGAGHRYGLSSRGLGVDIGGEEEFPDFTDFWLVRPGPDADALTFHALLDSPSATGAYTFELRPGDGTVLSVDVRLFARADVLRLGVAPMSSMFLYDASRAGEFDDFRPEVHDSDGLLMHTGRGERIWRPLSNRRTPIVTSLLDTDPRGFGLVQRTRDFDRYLDLEARYDLRPSQWVRPEGDWGSGAVQLLELPTDSEFRDNIAASWVPDGTFNAGEERRYRYELVTLDRVTYATLYRVERARAGWDALPGEVSPRPRSHRRFIVDFARGVESSVAGIEPVLESTSGTIADLRTEPLPGGAGWRVSWRLEPEGDTPADMRLFLQEDGGQVSETWSYVWYPSELDG